MATIINEGLIYALMALGVYITYSILDFPDLSVDGTFPLGSAVTATLILAGAPPFLTLFAAFAAGALAGTITGLIHVKLRVRDLLSGIIVMTGLYSVNLSITKAKANLPIFSKDNIFENDFVSGLPAAASPWSTTVILLLIILVVKVLLDLYMKTRSGYLLRAVGDNETLVTSLAKDKGSVKIVGLALANGLAALSGAVYCQQQGYFEISLGTGTIVMGLASVIIGTRVFARIGFIKTTTAVILGTIVYKACVSAAMAVGSSIGFKTHFMKLIISLLFLIILVISEHGRKKGN